MTAQSQGSHSLFLSRFRGSLLLRRSHGDAIRQANEPGKDKDWLANEPVIAHDEVQRQQAAAVRSGEALAAEMAEWEVWVQVY